MNLLRESPNLALAVPAFRVVAILEALSWAGLLAGMSLKYVLAPRGELGASLVTVFGSIHGGLVIVYVALAVLTALRLGWPRGTVALAVAATVPPFATLAFDRWAGRTGRYEYPRPARP